MTGLLLGFGLSFAAGAYFLLADLLHVSTRASTKAILQVAKIGKEKPSSLHGLLFRLSVLRVCWTPGHRTGCSPCSFKVQSQYPITCSPIGISRH